MEIIPRGLLLCLYVYVICIFFICVVVANWLTDLPFDDHQNEIRKELASVFECLHGNEQLNSFNLISYKFAYILSKYGYDDSKYVN